jgi:hypothetical protein
VCFLLTAGGPDAELLQEVESLKESMNTFVKALAAKM